MTPRTNQFVMTGRRWLAAALCAVLMGGCGGPSSDDAAPSSEIEVITTGAGEQMVVIPAGQFTMGSATGDDDEKPPHVVTIGRIYMDRFEVTQQSYETLMGSNPSKFKDPKRPVDRVSWMAAIKYCNLRSARENLWPCYNLQTQTCDYSANGYRLPTEAEWEYACRAGGKDDFALTDESKDINAFGWFKSNSGDQTHPVGQKLPNAWKLYDMHGNVAEWCNDWYGDKQYAQSARENPRGAPAGDRRVLRGGSWRAPVDRARCAARAAEAPGLADVCFGYDAYGFRCVRAAP